MTTFTAGELIGAITRAIEARDMPAAADLLMALAVVDPRAAETIADTVHMLAYLDKAARKLEGAP